MGKRNLQLIEMIRLLKLKGRENKAPIWEAVAEYLEGSRRGKIAVNLTRLARYTQEGDIAVVPGKLLGLGSINHRVKVAAFSFSAKAKRKVEMAGGACISIAELVGENPRGSGVKIIG